MAIAQTLTINQSGYSDIGRVRAENEDYLIYESIPQQFAFMIVADGMGGYQGGALASKTAATTAAEYLGNVLFQYAKDNNTVENSRLTEHLQQAMYQANQAVLNQKQLHPELIKMGTTLVIAVIIDNHLHIANIGDSRAYQYHYPENQLVQISEDHSIVQEMIKSGALTTETARTSQVRNQLTQAIGVGESLNIHTFHQTLTNTGLLLLCSDGLTEYLDDQAIHTELASGLPPSQSCHRLIEAANRSGGKDNITVAIMEYGHT